ncbi:MAG TPA: antibiotic resistance protein MarC, partial [Parabacteroides sp.]|nr:antibiotic resistance protein MarC [Parabacteroides sp.]
MESLFPFALLCFTSFFTLINPLGTMPVFLSMTGGMSEKERKRIVMKSTMVAFLIMITFTVFGRFLFQVFGLSTNGFRIAGGIIILKIGYDMLQAKYTHIKINEEEIQHV